MYTYSRICADRGLTAMSARVRRWRLSCAQQSCCLQFSSSCHGCIICRSVYLLQCESFPRTFTRSYVLKVIIARICLVVFSLLAEAPHDVMFFWKCVHMSFAARDINLTEFVQDASMGRSVAHGVDILFDDYMERRGRHSCQHYRLSPARCA